MLVFDSVNTCDFVSHTLLNNIEQHVQNRQGRQLILEMSFYASEFMLHLKKLCYYPFSKQYKLYLLNSQSVS